MARDIDPYRTLGLPRGAALDEVKRAYRRLAKINHPDAAGPGALPRFLAIQAAYEQIAGGPAGGRARAGASQRPASPGRRPSEADPDRANAAHRAYRPGSDETAPGARPGQRPGPRAGPRPESPPGPHPGRAPGPPPPRAGRPPAGERARQTDGGTPTDAAGPTSREGQDDPRTGRRAGRGKATLGSTSYDGADAGPFEPDWGGASWYGTTSGTYWTINPREYADPRKHGPEYQARARRATGAKESAEGNPTGSPAGGATAPGHTTSSWWESTTGSAPSEGDEFDAREPGREPLAGSREARAGRRTPRWAASHRPTASDRQTASARPSAALDPAIPGDANPAPDPARAAVDLGRALTDPHSGGLRGRALRAVLGWLPIALGIGWLVGEVSGCGRFAATCDPAVTPLVGVGQAIALVALFLVPEIAALAAGAALVLLAASVAASLILSATGAAADDASRRSALGVLLVLAWLIGLVVGVVRRIRSGPASARPVS